MKVKYFGFFRLEIDEVIIDGSEKTIFRYILREKKDRPVRVWWGDDKPADEKIWELTDEYGGATS